MNTLTVDELLRENEDLRHRLEEAEEALQAIRAGEVDAVFIEAEDQQVYTLETAYKPYRLLVEQMPHAAATLTDDGTIIYCNARFSDLLQRPLPALQGKPIANFISAADRPRLDALLRDGQGECFLRLADSTQMQMLLGVSTLQEGALGSCLIITDLTPQRHYEELLITQQALRESEARMAAELADSEVLQKISAQLIQQDDVEALYQQVVEAARIVMRSDMSSMQLLHAERNELELLAWNGFHPESAAFWKCVRLDSDTSCGEALRNGERVIVGDVEACAFIVDEADINANRRSGIRGVQSTPLISRTGRLLGMISTHWRVPHEPGESELRLLDVLARQAADLIERKQAEQALRDADRMKDEFLATLAHELRNPLAPIRNAVQILKAQAPPIPELQSAQDVIDRQVQFMGRLLEDLLDVSRVAHNKLELRTELVELTGVVEAALETSRPVIEAGRHELSVTLPPTPIRLEADSVRLAQVFANLLNNAAKYTEERGRIWLTVHCQGSDVIVSVKDDGIGILPEMLPRVFDIFMQSSRALQRSQGGLGIGLSLVKGLVELHGGSIEARSDGIGQGSEFIVRLPIASEATTREPDRTIKFDAPRAIAKQRVLIVDDNRDSADTLSMLLKIMGHEVDTAYDGEKAVEMAEVVRPEVVLLDIGMPKLNGYEACRRIRQQPGGQEMILIALTGWAQEEDRLRTKEAGFDYHLIKPADVSALETLLVSLEGRRPT